MKNLSYIVGLSLFLLSPLVFADGNLDCFSGGNWGHMMGGWSSFPLGFGFFFFFHLIVWLLLVALTTYIARVVWDRSGPSKKKK